MTQQELKIIRDFAAGDNSLLPAALRVYHVEMVRLLDTGVMPHSCHLPPAMRFMAETQSEHPDLLLRATCREVLTEMTFDEREGSDGHMVCDGAAA